MAISKRWYMNVARARSLRPNASLTKAGLKSLAL